ncbi:LysR family transcriptional regulator [Pseudonocardia eucalypti]|uniref:LysR family transcriptional regulator n=1 Tax=Pseudonocardia eucalypti TaxID=648755 RepID=A0ABP9QLL7_9PSEU|nr:DNA-binding transcriptional LysR family regulator [Pseudonocardia eucalypti]
MTGAAAELGITQSAVSHALRALERELGVALLVRHSAGVELTDAGRVAVRRAIVIIDQLDGLTGDLDAARADRLGGELRLGVVPSVNARVVPAVLREFTTEQPQARLAVLEGSDGEVLEWLRTGAVDVATVAGDAPDLVGTPLTSDRVVAVVSSAHRVAGRESVALAELAADPFIMSTGGCEPLVAGVARRAGVALRCHYRVRDMNSILAMVAAGLGATIVPELAVPAVAAGVSLVPLEPAERRSVSLASLADVEPSALVTAFRAVVQRVVRPESGLPSGR